MLKTDGSTQYNNDTLAALLGRSYPTLDRRSDGIGLNDVKHDALLFVRVIRAPARFAKIDQRFYEKRLSEQLFRPLEVHSSRDLFSSSSSSMASNKRSIRWARTSWSVPTA